MCTHQRDIQLLVSLFHHQKSQRLHRQRRFSSPVEFMVFTPEDFNVICSYSVNVSSPVEFMVLTPEDSNVICSYSLNVSSPVEFMVLTPEDSNVICSYSLNVSPPLNSWCSHRKIPTSSVHILRMCTPPTRNSAAIFVVTLLFPVVCTCIT